MREANMVHRALAETADAIAKREHELRLSDEHTHFILRELSHRSKNLLAIIQSMARQTSRNSRNMAEFERRFEERISGLARSHDLLIGRNWQGAMLADLVESQLAPFVDNTRERVTFAGPDILVRPGAAHTLGMVLHELATNASKYGALSCPSGRIEIDWSVEHPMVEPPHFHMKWREIGGPPVSPPERHGFGHVVIERMTASAFGGAAHVSWERSGFIWELDAPASAIDAAIFSESKPADGDPKVNADVPPAPARVSTPV
jgi:two-component sensor histidine kinase